MMATSRCLQFYLGMCVGLSLTVLIQVYQWTWSIPHIHIQTYKADRNAFTDNSSCVCSGTKERSLHLPKNFLSDADGHDGLFTRHRRAIHVQRTWAKRCNVILFMSSAANSSFPAVGLDVLEGRQHLTEKTMKAFKYVYDNYKDLGDWFMKADDDTYVIMENLRYLLSDENPNEAVYFGMRFRPYVRQGYPSGGGGYVLSREALHRFGAEGFNNSKLCQMGGEFEDVQMGRCLQNLGVRLKPSLDRHNRSRFHCLSPEDVLKSAFPDWYSKFNLDNINGGMENISDYAISFHYVTPDKMYELEFYTYHLKPYGILNKPQNVNLHR